jgi:hypothetical protein
VASAAIGGVAAAGYAAKKIIAEDNSHEAQVARYRSYSPDVAAIAEAKSKFSHNK